MSGDQFSSNGRKNCWSHTEINFLGLIDSPYQYYSNNMVRLPVEKLSHIKQLLQSWRRRKGCSKHELLSLCGNWQHASSVVKTDCTFFGAWLTYQSIKSIWMGIWYWTLSSVQICSASGQHFLSYRMVSRSSLHCVVSTSYLFRAGLWFLRFTGLWSLSCPQVVLSLMVILSCLVRSAH